MRLVTDPGRGALAATLAALSLLAAAVPANADHLSMLGAAAWGEHRDEGNRERNRYRHPVETLDFFGIQPDMTVVEISPGGGWYSEVLASYLREQGEYIAAIYSTVSENESRRRSARQFVEKLKRRGMFYTNIQFSVFEPPVAYEVAEPGSADMVLTFRNTHGWMQADTAREAFDAMYEALKPGGILGVVQHRGEPGNPAHRTGEAGYLDENYLIGFIEASGFELVATSEINANPLDTRDHPDGVWTLPPTLSLGEEDREKYLRIGESDRMTLKFVKR